MKYTPIACCAFCGDDATQRAEDGTAVCENCAVMYKAWLKMKEKR